MRSAIDIFEIFNSYAWKNPHDQKVRSIISEQRSRIEGADQYKNHRWRFWGRSAEADQYAYLLGHIIETRRDELRRAPNMVFSYSGDQ